jgi:hypothetical protein
MNVLTAVFGGKPSDARLRLAKEKRAAAQQAVLEQREKLERLQTVVNGADQTARAASDAQHAAKEFRTQWAREGCRFSDAAELQRLENLAIETSATAQRAAVHADTVRVEFRRLQSDLESRQTAVRHVEDEITAAIGVILAEEAAPLLAEFEEAATTYRQLREKAMAVSLALAKPWGLDYNNRMNPSHEGESVVDAAIERARIERWGTYVDNRRDPQAFVDALKAPARARMQELRS